MTAKTTTASMFESIKGALDKASKNTGYRDLLKLEPGKSYQVRLLPNIKNPEDTFYHYFHHGWKSVVTGQYMSAISPSTWGERCPISEEYFKLYREANGDKTKQEVAKNLKRKESWYVNVYVIEDPTTPDNNGKVKIVRFGKQLMKIIENAISGEDANEFGPRIFDLSPDGCTFRIKPENKSEKGKNDFAVEYVSSRFLTPSAIPNLTDEKINEILNSLHDLASIDETKDEDELREMLSVHFYNQNQQTEPKETVHEKTSNVPVETAKIATNKLKTSDTKEDDINMSPSQEKVKTPVAEASSTTKSDEDAIAQLLDGLNK